MILAGGIGSYSSIEEASIDRYLRPQQLKAFISIYYDL